MKGTTQSFYAGVLVVSGLMMAWQDYLGLEKYVAHARLTWVDLSPYWGLVAALVGALLYYHALNRRQA